MRTLIGLIPSLLQRLIIDYSSLLRHDRALYRIYASRWKDSATAYVIARIIGYDGASDYEISRIGGGGGESFNHNAASRLETNKFDEITLRAPEKGKDGGEERWIWDAVILTCEEDE